MDFAHNQFETDLWNRGFSSVVGIDEVGRGCWAGPAVVGAVIFPKNFTPLFKLADSKQLSEKKRKQLVPQIKEHAIAHAIHEVPLELINQVGVGKAIQQGFNEILKIISVTADFILIDAFKIKGYPPEKQQAIIKGDQQSISIAAASIIAKEYRDNVMRQLHETEPLYNFKNNVGYGTKEHRDAIAKHGLSLHHRTSFNLSNWIGNNVYS